MPKAQAAAEDALVSVIILNFNGLRFAERCVKSVLESEYSNIEVVVVDNASTDGSYELLTRLFGTVPSVRIVRNSRNLGFAEGNNVGYRNSNGEIVVFLNIDTEVQQNWLGPLVSLLASDDQVGGAQCKLLDMKSPGAIDSLGSQMDFLGYVYPCRSNSYDWTREIFYADGAAMAFKRGVLSEVAFDGNPFDHSHFLYYEDNDLCWRVRLRGYRIILLSSSVVYHYRGGAGGRKLDFMRVLFFTRSHIMTLMKNYAARNLAWFLLALISLELGQSVVLLFSDPRKSMAKLRAILWCMRNLRTIWMKRQIVQAKVRRVPDSEIMRWMIKPNLRAASAGAKAFY